MRLLFTLTLCWIILLNNSFASDLDDIKKIETYFNSFHSLKGTFTQNVPNGETLSGRIYLKRPGKMRFEYDPPSYVSIIATGYELIQYERDLETASRISQSNSLADILTRMPFKILSDDIKVIQFQKKSKLWYLTLQHRNETDKKLTLVFKPEPMKLVKWMVQDIDGRYMSVNLSDYKTNVPLDKDLFLFINPEKEKAKWKAKGYTP